MSKVSVIIPIYNVQKFLHRCLRSIINQTFKDLEIILVDDGSPDDCPKICDDYAMKDNRIKVIHKHNEGLGYARNSGMNAAKGEYIVFIDSDDYVDIHMIEKLYNVATSKNFNAVYCGHYYERNGIIIDKVPEVDKYTEFIGNENCRKILLEMIGGLHRGNPLYTMSVWHSIFNLKFLRLNKIQFPSERQFISEDMIFDIDFFSIADRVALIPECYYYYCANGNSLSLSFKENLYERRRKHYLEILRKMRNNGFSSFELCVTYKHMILTTQFYLFQATLACNKEDLKNMYNKVFNDRKIWTSIYKSDVKSILAFKQYIFYLCLVYRWKFIMFLINKILVFKQIHRNGI